MANVNFGAHQGKDHKNLTTGYLQWMLQQLEQGPTNFNLSNNGKRLDRSEMVAEIQKELSRRGIPGYSNQNNIPQSPQPPQKQPKPQPTNTQNTQGLWVLAKSIAANPEYKIPAANLDLAMKQHDPDHWMFVILDPEENRLVSRGTIPTLSVRSVVKRELDSNGEMITGSKPSEILTKIRPKKKKGGNLISDEQITDEQQAVDAKFERMMHSGQSHMIINALAGSGKTTLLKHLAWKYAAPNPSQQWLYLVFGTKNKEEAKGEFPPNVKVDTTNGWAGREVLGKNVLKPTDRIQDYSKARKAELVADTPRFRQYTISLNIPDPIEEFGDDKERMSGTERGLWNILKNVNHQFKKEALKVLGLAKAFAVDPRSPEMEKKLQEDVFDNYDVDGELREIKENIAKNSPWATHYLNDLFHTNFMEKDFTPEIKQAAIWLMQQTMPHASEDKFTADIGKSQGTEQALGNKRDFDDDLWFSAIHANELRWPKYSVVLVDEVQDFNTAQKIVLHKLSEQGAKIVAVGDPNQAIYGFRGADNNSFANITNMLRDNSENKDVEMPLTKNFRSRQAIIDLTNAEGEESGHVSNLVKGRDFKEGPGKIGAGEATKYEKTYNDAFNTLKSEMKDMGETKPTAFLSRTNDPLIHAGLKLMKDNIPFTIIGKDISSDLIKHIDKVINMFRLKNNDSAVDLNQSIVTYTTEQNDRHRGKAAMTGQLKELKETSEAILAALGQFMEEKEDASIYDFRKWLKEKFNGIDLEEGGVRGEAARKEFKRQQEMLNPVILSTVHKSKGLQFQRVYILRDDLWPHPKASRPNELAQEMNNKYIGRTRAEDELHILDLPGQPGYKNKGSQNGNSDGEERNNRFAA